jgi:hypothetical protein
MGASNDSAAWPNFAIVLCRDFEESIAQIRAGLQSDPLSLPINNFVGVMYFAARQSDQAIAASRKTLELEPRFGPAHSVLGAALEAKCLNDL